MEEINFTTHDEYGMKAGGILASMQKFETYIGLQLAYTLFGASESLSRSLQAKDLSIQEALSAVNLAKGFYKHQRTEQTFNFCYDKAVHNAESLQIGRLVLPRYKDYQSDWIKEPNPMSLKHQRVIFVNNTLKLVIYYLESWMIGLTSKVCCHLSWLWKTLC